MKKFKFLSFVLTLALVFNIAAPISYAAEPNSGATVQMNTPVTDGDYTISGAETAEVRFNILINNTDQTGQFAIAYLDSPDYMYEFTFELDDATTNTSSIDFTDIQAYCFDNENQWHEVYLPSAVTVFASKIQENKD